MPINLNVSLQPKQRIALQVAETSPVTFYGGSKGGGKSHLIRVRELLRRLQFPKTKGLIVRKTYPELLSNHIRMFFAEYPATVGWFNKSEKTIYWPNGSTTEFSYLSAVDDVYTYQGREYEDISIDEITQHEEDVFKILRSSNRTTNPNIKPSMLLTGNPGGIGHGWVKRIFIDRLFKDNEYESDFAFVQARVTDNMALMDNDPDYVKRLDDLPEHLRRAYKDGDWDIFAGQVFDFRATKDGEPYHVIEPTPIPSNAIRFISIDWGGNKPVSIGWKAVIDAFTPDGIKFNRIWKYREKYYGDEDGIASAEDFKRREKMDFTDVNVARMIEKESEGEEINYVVGDPSMASQKPRSVTGVGESVMESMNNEWSKGDSGLFIKKGDNNRKTGLDRVRFWLSEAPDGKPYYQIFKNCKDTIRTYPLLIYEDGKDDVDTTIEDHIYDEDRYGFMSRPYGAMDEKEKEPKETRGTFDYHLDRQRRKRIDASIDTM